jgi:hypothetical protein
MFCKRIGYSVSFSFHVRDLELLERVQESLGLIVNPPQT